MKSKFQIKFKDCCSKVILRMIAIVCLVIVCQSAWGSWTSGGIWEKVPTDGKLWDELVSDKNRPSGITTNSSGNYVITIKSAEELAWYAWKLRTESNGTELGKYAYAEISLDDDINLSGHSWRGIGEVDDGNHNFHGTFDGKGHTIKNMICDRYNGDWGAGLFDEAMSNVEIRNVNFYNCESRIETGAGIVVGTIRDASDIKITNIVIDNCYLAIKYYDAGFVVGDIRNSKKIVFDNITVKNSGFDYGAGSNFGGLVGQMGWGDNEATVKNCFVSLRASAKNAYYGMGGITSWIDHGSTLDVDNCVIDISDPFFTGNQDQAAIVGAWGDTSKPKVRHTLVVANPQNPTLPSGKNVGLFGGYSGGSSAMELSDCFIHNKLNPNPSGYQIVSKQIADRNMCYTSNIKNIDYAEASAREAAAIVNMNEKGACFGINPSYTNSSALKDFVIPLASANQGKLVRFAKNADITDVGGGVPRDFTIASDMIVMAQGKVMYYVVKERPNEWIVADNSTMISPNKRTEKWKFSGVPTGAGKGELKFTYAERPVAKWVDGYPKYNQTTQRVVLKWDVSSKGFGDYWKNHGKWVIYKNGVVVETLDGTAAMEWTDFSPGSSEITYEVFFVSEEYLYEKSDNPSTHPTHKIKPQYNVVLNAVVPFIKDNKVVNTVNVPNAQSLNGSRVRLLRWDTSVAEQTQNKIEAILQLADQLTVYNGEFLYDPQKADETLPVTAEDNVPASTICTMYHYMWVVDNVKDDNFKGKTFTTDVLSLTDNSDIKFMEFTATKGKSTSKVTLKWNVDNDDNVSMKYVVYRTVYDKDDTSTPDTWTNVYETNSGLTTGTFDDEILPGYVYKYCIRAYPFCEGTASKMNYSDEAYDIGFAASRGTIQGRVTFNSGKANVEGVDVKLKSDDDELANSMLSYSVQFAEDKQFLPLAEGLGEKFWDGDWTLQFLLRPDKDGVVASLPGRMKLTLKEDMLYLSDENAIRVNMGTFIENYIVVKHADEKYQLGYITLDGNDKAVVNWTSAVSDVDMEKIAGKAAENDILYFGNNKAYLDENSFRGCIDEIRLWKDVLSDKSIADTYNRYLSGNEKHLMAYYTFDSGVGEYAFDSSHPSGNWNNRHSVLPTEEANKPIVTSKFVPDADVLTYRGTTDKNGEYTISGIPFEGEGTNWQIVPSFGAHDFSPTSTRRLVSTNTLVHTGIDFTDVSSFKVKGRVYYENTNIPVQGCNITIDGTAVTEGATMAETDADGEFSVDVPIGTHTLAMSMNGHTFTDSLTMYFNREVHDLWFYDNTRVTVAGRVVGGELEYAKPVGLAQSKNNIGTAYITLKPTNDNYYFTAENDKDNLYVVPSRKQIDYENALKYSNNATAHTGKAISDTDMGDANRIYIKTDSLTGEFAASLPPMRYEVASITIPTADDDINAKLQQNLSYLDARNTTEAMTDSVWTGATTSEGEPVFDKFTYNTSYKTMVTTPAILEVWQTEEDKNFFGEDSVKYVGNEGLEISVAAYRNGQYTMGAEGSEKRPVFNQFENYIFHISASQKYLNRDDRNNVVEDIMPLAYKTVTINNYMSYENSWYVDENGATSFVEIEGTEYQLDSLGCGEYKFKVGTPNTTAPFEVPLSIDLDNGLAHFNLSGIVLGAVSYGNSFVTQGPSFVSMVLRDPPGSNSYATWTKGSTITTGFRHTSAHNVNTGAYTEAALGWAAEYVLGPGPLNWRGKWGVNVTEASDNLYLSGGGSASGWTTTVTTTQDISTSSAPEFDGPDADIFIGYSTNTVSGNGKQVMPIKNGDGVVLDVKDVRTSAFSFGTSFIYSQYQIKKSVIQNLLAERRKLIEDPATLPNDSNFHYVPKVEFSEWMKMTDEEKDALLDKGINEGYEIKSNIQQYATDSVSAYKAWADNWKNVLRENERAKDDAYNGNYLKENYTFDAASSQTFTTSVNEMKIIKDDTDYSGYTYEVKDGVKLYIGAVGETEAGFHRQDSWRYEDREYEEEENLEVFSYTLAEDGVNDILTVDRMTAPDGFGDIFRTRAGQTSAFWAPQYVTEYYNPGTEIMAPTLMVNKPKLELVNPEQQIISNVRRGTSATIQFRIINESEAKCNGYYRMCLVAENNKNGAVCTFNGNPLNNDGVGVWLEYGKPQIITVSVSEPQTPIDDTYDLTFYLIDDKQTLPVGPMMIYPSEQHVIVKFVKSSSEINLASDKSVINAELLKSGTAKISFTLKDYDLKMENLKYIDLQQWNGQKFLSLGDSARWERTGDMAESVKYVLDMSDPNNFPDGEYRFRARTVSNYGEGEVEAYSEEITILKDVSAPQPISNLMPVRGVLGNDNEISVEFNEDIVGDIRKNTNVVLYGELIDNESAREISVYFNGGTDVVSTDAPIQALQKGMARSFNLWVKWTGNAGTIFTLGANSNKTRFGIDGSGRFTIVVNTHTYRSTTVFEKDKWTFLSIIVDDTHSGTEDGDAAMLVTASYILEEGKDVVWLMGDKDGGMPVPNLATTAAPLFIGTGFHGYIQDFSMWDGVRDMNTSNNEKSLVKTRFTPNLLAYWPMNEGYGKTLKEVVSEKDMYLTSENMWSIDNKNYAMRLDKGQKAQLIFSNVNTNYDEDYLLQAWFNVDASENDPSTGSETSEAVDTLISYPNGNTQFVIPRKTGNLVLMCKQDSVVISSKNIADGHWHQLSMMVKKSENGNATIYLDGNNVGQVAAKKIDTMQGVLFLGDTSGFSGCFDEIRVWNGLQNSQAISDNLNNRYSTTDCPIAAYFPFEVSGLNQTVDFSLSNYGNMKADGDTVRLVITDPNIPLSQQVIAQETEIVPPLKSVPTLVTRDFSIVNSERKIRINIDEKEIKNVQGTTLTALVRGLRDEAGNVIQDIRWSFLVEMNDIEWDEFATMDYEPELYGEYVGSAKISNNTGTEQSWRIDNVPYWMEFSCYGGALKPNETMTLLIRAKENIPIGNNSGVLSLVDSKGMYHKQAYSINYIPNSPDWAVDSLYSQAMTVTGQVRINRVVQENSLSKLAAFNNLGDCVGMATPKYVKEKNSYYYTMMIHGNEWYLGKEIAFKFYDANNGVFYASVEPTEPIVFSGDYANIGSIEAPIYWDTTGKIEQIINIDEGWNWISFNTREESTVEEVFANPQPSALNPQPSAVFTEVKDKNHFARYYNGRWEYDDDFGAITHSRMYKVKAERSATLSRIGKPANDLGSRIGIAGMTNGKPGWSWIGADISTNMALTTAMGGLTSAPKVGDVIKNHNQFAEYTTSGWIGDLNTIIPGKGYMYMSNDEEKKYLIYPYSLANSPKSSSVRLSANQDADPYAEYGGSATVIAAVELDGVRMDGCHIYAVDAEGNVCGDKAVSDKNGYHLAYLVVHGNAPETVGFKVVFGEDDNSQTFESTTTLDCFDGLSIGTSDEPFIIRISGAVSITGVNTDNSADTLYDLAGRPVSASQTKLGKGVYIKNNKKVIIK